MLLNCAVGEDSWESLGQQNFQPAHPKGNQSWIITARTYAEAETNTLATWCEELTHLKRPQCWKRLKVGGEGDDRGWGGWMASPTWWTWVWVSFDGETMTDFIFLGLKITVDGGYSHKIKRCLLLERKAMTNLDNTLKSRDITLPTKVRLVKDMFFPIVMHR